MIKIGIEITINYKLLLIIQVVFLPNKIRNYF